MLNWQNISEMSILLVDDEADNLEVIAESLMFHGFTVKTAANGTDALTVLETFTPSLILTDLSMPKMDGWQLRTHVRALPQMAQVPIVALTAHAMVGDMERALEVGFDGYMTKPINVPTLVQDLRKALVKLENPNAVIGQPLASHPPVDTPHRKTMTTAAIVVIPNLEPAAPAFGKEPEPTVKLSTLRKTATLPAAAVEKAAPASETKPVEALPAKDEPAAVVAQINISSAPVNDSKVEQ